MRGAFFQLPPVLFVRDVVQTYGRLGVSRAAASLAYFLILTLFPLLVCVNFFIGLLELDPEAVFSALDPLLPRESLSIILEYLTYVSGIPQSQSTPLLLASLFTILLSASAGLRTLLKTMDELYQVRHVSSLRRVAVSVILSLLFLLTIYLSIVVIFTGDWFFQVLEERLPPPLAELIPLRLLSQLWGWLRYLLAVDDNGNAFEVSADPLKDDLQAKLATIKFGAPDSCTDQLDSILSNASIFGSDLTKTVLADKVKAYFKAEIAGPGAVRKTLHDAVNA